MTQDELQSCTHWPLGAAKASLKFFMFIKGAAELQVRLSVAKIALQKAPKKICGITMLLFLEMNRLI